MKDLFFEELKQKTEAEIHFDEIHNRIYSVDASIFEMMPIGVAIPKTTDDLTRIIKIAHKYQVPVIARGAATGITGGCIGKALIIDLSKYLKNILEINIEDEYVVVEPGVVQDQLNEALSSFGYRLGPDTSTGNRATIGGMMANNSAGARSLLFGKMVDHVLEMDLSLENGETIHLKPLDIFGFEKKLAEQTAEGSIYREIDKVLTEYKHEIETHFPKIPRRVSGYNLDLLNFHDSFNLCKLITGSEGTLGIASKIKLRISKKLKSLGLSVIHFHDMADGMKAIPYLLSFDPVSLEMIDDIIINLGVNTKSMQGELEFLDKKAKMIFIAEFQGDTEEIVKEKLKTFQQQLKIKNIGYGHVSLTEKKEMDALWNMRKSGLGLLLSKKSYTRAIAFIEDLSIPPGNLYIFMTKFLEYMKKNHKTAGIYGHVGSGCMHIRPYINLREPDDLQMMEKIMLDVTDLVLEHGGAMSGEHGDGMIRSWLTEKCFGPRLYEAFVRVKKAFDPQNLMNPGKIVNGQPLLQNLRQSPATEIATIKTFLDFSKEGGFDLAIDLCNGNGMCRKKESVMCPSFQASEDEYDTTRARAQVLRGIINSHFPKEDLTSKQVNEVLDLCIECKGCKTECPSHVDMAKIKSEVLYQTIQKNGAPLRSYLFGHIALINKLNSKFGSLFNYIIETRIFKNILEKVGITKERPLPKLCKERFSVWFKRYKQPKGLHKKIVLFNDTYNEFNEPHIGISAVKVLNHLGFEVIVQAFECCGRPMISKGLLAQAKAQAQKVYDRLLTFAKADIPIIGLEPSCILTIKDDFESLIGSKAAELVKMCMTFDEFIYKHPENLEKIQRSKKVLVHGHCHQKSLVGMKPTMGVLKHFGFDASEIDSGCCGMAGSFGYEKEHYAFSMKIANLKLFPSLEKAEDQTIIMANGISCRSQIAHGTNKKAMHLAEILDQYLLLP